MIARSEQTESELPKREHQKFEGVRFSDSLVIYFAVRNVKYACGV